MQLGVMVEGRENVMVHYLMGCIVPPSAGQQ